MSAIQGANPVRSKNIEQWTLSGRVKGPNASVSVVKGKGFTCAGGGTGIYVLTLDKAPTTYFGAGLTVFSATLGFDAQVTAYSVSAGTITITTYKTDTKTATDLGASDELWFTIDFGWSQRS